VCSSIFPLCPTRLFAARHAVCPVAAGVRVRAATARWLQRRISQMLDDRMLRDIGISRSQALAEAAKPCWRR
jgi:uncharacterized protein YjiS (DUF1127 family)